jgi:hypothetical protein
MHPGFVDRRRLIIPLGIALLGLGINIIVATSMAETADEGGHVSYGGAILRGKPDRFKSSFDSKMPVSALNAFPRGVGTFLRDHGMAPGLANILRDMRATRYATIAAAFCLCRESRMAKLGSDKRPAIVRVRTMPKGEEIVALCERHHWKVIVGMQGSAPWRVRDVFGPS